MGGQALTQGQADMKLSNLLTVFHLLVDREPVSRAELAKLSGMSPTSITRFVGHMLALGLLRETPDREKKVGRTATLLRLEESALYSVGISLDSTYIHVALLNFRKKLVGERAEKNPFAAPTLEQALGVAHRLYTDLLQETGVPPAQVCGVGVTMPGVMQGSEILAFTPQLQWKGLNVRRAVQQRFGTENVRVENDCNAALLGQCVLDPELRKQDAAFLCIGSGVGSAVSYQGRLFSKPGGLSFSEIGHTVVQPDGMVCDCGNRGCLQTFLTVGALVNRARAYDSTVASMEDIGRAWQQGVPWARELIGVACTYAKMAVNTLSCMYTPQVILIGGESIDCFGEMFGGIFSEPQLFFEPFKGRVELRRLNGMYRKGLVGVSQQVQEDSLREKLRRAL